MHVVCAVGRMVGWLAATSRNRSQDKISYQRGRRRKCRAVSQEEDVRTDCGGGRREKGGDVIRARNENEKTVLPNQDHQMTLGNISSPTYQRESGFLIKTPARRYSLPAPVLGALPTTKLRCLSPPPSAVRTRAVLSTYPDDAEEQA